MNSLRKIFFVLASIGLFGGMMHSCKQQVFDNLESCERGIYVNLYDQTECAETPSYPQVNRLSFYAFDLQDRLVATVEYGEHPALSESKEFFVPVAEPGSYSVVAWANLTGDLYNMAPVQVGKTTKQELLMSLKEQQEKAIDLTGKRLWVGTTPVVEVGKEASFYAHTKANIREITNRINVSVEGLDVPQDYTIAIQSANGAYSLEGQILPAKELDYPTTTYVPKDSTLAADFTTLKLQSGRKSSLIVRNLKTNKTIFTEDLVGVILLSPSKDNINLRCLNDYRVKLRVRRCPNDPGTYMVTSLWINNILVHSYDIEFS